MDLRTHPVSIDPTDAHIDRPSKIVSFNLSFTSDEQHFVALKRILEGVGSKYLWSENSNFRWRANYKDQTLIFQKVEINAIKDNNFFRLNYEILGNGPTDGVTKNFSYPGFTREE